MAAFSGWIRGGTVDVERLFVALLKQAYPGTTVTVAPDVDAPSKLPIIVVTATSGERVGNGDRRLGQTWNVAVSVLARTRKEASSLASGVSEHMDSFAGMSVPDVGSVSYVDETSLFARAPQYTIAADNVHQFNAVFRAIVRK